MPDNFETDVDIANRALQHLGARRIASLTETSKNASEILACYSKLRQAELRRRVWRFAIRRAALRPVDGDTMLVEPPAWANDVLYAPGSIVTSDGRWYQAAGWIAAGGAAPDDTTTSRWVRYVGPDVAVPYDSSETYFAGELVYTPKSNAYRVYLSLANDNDTDPTDPEDWSATTNYSRGQSVKVSSTEYWSEQDINYGNDPTGGTPWTTTSPATSDAQWGVHSGQKWLDLGDVTDGATGLYLKALLINTPIGVGPAVDNTSRSVYRLPYGFLRHAPQNPRAGSFSPLGAPGNEPVSDWELQGNYFTSFDTGTIVLRFVADVAAVPDMDAMFCEGLAARIAVEICEVITQSDSKLQNIASAYSKFMGEAGIVNAIEVGSTEPALDDYLACRR